MDIIANAILAIGLHELAHLAAARAIGVRIYQVGISRRGPFVRRDPGSAWQNLMITLAGPSINLLGALLLCRISSGFALSNLVLGITNLIPFPSSDGSRALSLLTTMRNRAALSPPTCSEHGEAEPISVTGSKGRGQAA
jgi:Zn-dependent protease